MSESSTPAGELTDTSDVTQSTESTVLQNQCTNIKNSMTTEDTTCDQNSNSEKFKLLFTSNKEQWTKNKKNNFDIKPEIINDKVTKSTINSACENSLDESFCDNLSEGNENKNTNDCCNGINEKNYNETNKSIDHINSTDLIDNEELDKKLKLNKPHNCDLKENNSSSKIDNIATKEKSQSPSALEILINFNKPKDNDIELQKSDENNVGNNNLNSLQDDDNSLNKKANLKQLSDTEEYKKGDEGVSTKQGYVMVPILTPYYDPAGNFFYFYYLCFI